MNSPRLRFSKSVHKDRAFSHDVTTAILVSQNNQTAAMLVFQTSPVGVELFSFVKILFWGNKFVYLLATSVLTLYKILLPTILL